MDALNKAKLIKKLLTLDNIKIYNVFGIGNEFIFIADNIQMMQKESNTFRLIAAIDVTHFVNLLSADFDTKFKEYLKNITPFALNIDFRNFSYQIIQK